MTRRTSGPPAVRDHRIDWLRGFALVSIFINHMPGNRLEHWTLRNFGFSDAAELFVLLAGVAAALAFFRRYERGETFAMTVKALRRTGTLYVAHVVSTLGAVALFVGAAAILENQGYLDLIGVGPISEAPLLGLIGIMTGGYQLGFFNILPMYVVLLVCLPAMLWLAVRDLRLLVAASAGLYLATQVLQLRLPSFPDDSSWFFNPLGWQLLFVSGLVLGILRLRGQFAPYHPAVFALAICYLVFSAVWMVFSLGGTLSQGVLPSWIDTLRKSNLAPLRLLHIFALGYVLVHSRFWTWLTRIATVDPLLTRFGRNSLPVFVTASFASMVGYIALVWFEEQNLALELVMTGLGLCAMWVVAFISELGPRIAWVTLKGAFWQRGASPAPNAVPFLPVEDEVKTTPTGRHDS